MTPEKLQQIDQAEAGLRELGFADFRVRHHGDIARIELPAEDLLRAVTMPLAGDIRRTIQRAGFRYATVDLGGMQSGAFTLTVLNTAGNNSGNNSGDNSGNNSGDNSDA